MNFGVRLPGPFRVGMSSKGRMSVGATLGPFSVSTGAGGGRPAGPGEMFHPTQLDDAVGQLVVAGWRLTGHDGQSAILTSQDLGRLGWLLSGWRAVQIDAVEGGVTWRQITSRRTAITKTVIWAAVAVGLFMLCTSGT